ncbi:MAG: hypothetical protein MK196_11215 [Acidimicrobiales bacterium]|nr:hypothetical protein [Acidimicrobiales bacterium]
MNAELQVLDRPSSPTFDLDALIQHTQKRGELIPQTIDTLHSTLGELNIQLDPTDEVRPFDQASLRYVDGKAAFSFRNEDGSWSTPMGLTSHAYRQLGTKVLGPGGLKFVEAQRTTDETGMKMATINWMERLSHAGSRGLFRSMQFPGQDFRTIRGVLSGSDRGFMTNLDNLDVVGLLADHPSFRELPLLSWRVTPDAMRIRGLLNPEDAAKFDDKGKPIDPDLVESRIPVPMFEIGNGEIGNSAVVFSDGAYTYSCLNGMGGWGDSRFVQRWTHTGGNDRGEKIQSALGDAIKSARVSSAGLVEDFKASTRVAVDDVFALLDQWGRKEGLLTAAQTRRATEGSRDETSFPGRNLANVVSGITLAAQDETDLQAQRKMEQAGTRIMQRGLRYLEMGSGSLSVDANGGIALA